MILGGFMPKVDRNSTSIRSEACEDDDIMSCKINIGGREYVEISDKKGEFQPFSVPRLWAELPLNKKGKDPQA